MNPVANNSVIRVQNLGKIFRVYRKSADFVWELLTRKRRHSEFAALTDVSFEVKRGEVVGIVGRNGSGKSTLLKILTGVLDSTAGQIEVRGKVSAILELGTGFNPEYTGRENVIRGGMIIGMSRAEIESKIESIIEFSGLREFIDRPFKSYSSGMQARLTFATATAVEPDIFLVDEALATGDAFFVQKSLHRIRKICKSGCTALLVSHGTSILPTICDRVLWLERGRVKRFGNPIDVIREYDLSIHEELSAGEGRVVKANLVANAAGREVTVDDLKEILRSGETHETCVVFRRGPICIQGVDLLDGEGRATTVFNQLGAMTIRVWYTCEGSVPPETLGLALAINQKAGLLCVNQFNTNCYDNDDDMVHYDRAAHRIPAARQGYLEAHIDPLQLRDGDYFLSIGLLPNIPENWAFYEYHHLGYTFTVQATGSPYLSGGVYRPQVTWRHCPEAVSTRAA